MIQLNILCILIVLFAVAESNLTNELFLLNSGHPLANGSQLKRSLRDNIGYNRMVNTAYRATKNQKLNENEIHQEQKNQQFNLINQYSSFFISQLQSTSGPDISSSLSKAELKMQLKAAYRKILWQRRKKLMQFYK